MSTISPFLSIDFSCDQALRATKAKLSQAGLSAVQTFNLNTARLGTHDCSCPNHGTEACDCQMIVLLVYGNIPEPATLILHGNDGKTWLSIADTAIQKVDAQLLSNIRQVLASLVTADA
jgi:hypothetical protein